MRIRLERDEAEGVEGRRLRDRHVVRRAKRRACDVAAGGPAAVRNAAVDPISDQVDDAGFVHAGDEGPRVAAAHRDGRGFANGLLRILESMDRDDLVSERLEGVLNLLFIAVICAGDLGVRNEEDLMLRAAVELLVLLARKIEVA